MSYNVNDRNPNSDWFKNENSNMDFILEDCDTQMPNQWKREDGTSMWQQKTGGTVTARNYGLATENGRYSYISQ